MIKKRLRFSNQLCFEGAWVSSVIIVLMCLSADQNCSYTLVECVCIIGLFLVQRLRVNVSGTVAQLLALLALPPHSKKVMGSIPTLGAVGSGGQVLPRVHSARVGYLPGLSVWSLHVLPRPSVLRWAISQAFSAQVGYLPGLSVCV